MALRAAIATGNWSNPAIWNGGVLPTTGDVVASNNFTVTIDQNINVDTLTNTAQSIVGMVPNMTSNTLPSGIVDQSSFLVGFEGWKAFGSGEWRFNLDGWVSYEFTSPKAVNQYYFQGDTSKSAWNFEAWNGSNWIVLHSVTGASTGVYTSPLIGNSTSYIKYRLFFFHTTNGNRVDTVQFYEYLGTSSAVAGGGFVLNGGVTTTLTNTTSGISYISTTPVITWNQGAGTIANIVANILAGGAGAGILILGLGTINITATRIIGNTGSGGTSVIHINSNATVNITSELVDSPNSGSGSDRACVRINSNSTLNITGNLIVNGTATDCQILSIPVPTTINITGNMTSASGSGVGSVINSGTAYFLTHIGSIIVTGQRAAIISTSTSAINLFTGPFVCSTYGFVPLQVVRMHLIPTTSSYFEFRDETTNGAVSPGAIAPATQLVSPATLISNLATSDVRFGIVYALGTLTGTLRMPVANQVTFGIPVDTTFGNAVLTAASVWDYLVSNITTADSIGVRLKNVATPQTTGEQLEAFLRLD